MSIESHFDPDERRREAMMEGSGFSSHLADARLSDEAIPGTSEPPRERRERKRRPTGHVRDFESDRDHDLAAERAAYEPLSDEQLETNRRGAEMLRKSMADRAIQNIVDRVNAMIPIDPDNVAKSEEARERHLNALLRTHFDRKK